MSRPEDLTTTAGIVRAILAADDASERTNLAPRQIARLRFLCSIGDRERNQAEIVDGYDDDLRFMVRGAMADLMVILLSLEGEGHETVAMLGLAPFLSPGEGLVEARHGDL